MGFFLRVPGIQVGPLEKRVEVLGSSLSKSLAFSVLHSSRSATIPCLKLETVTQKTVKIDELKESKQKQDE